MTDLNSLLLIFESGNMKKNKPWVSNILVDLFVTVIIAAAVILEYQWLIYIIVVYTGIILIARVLMLFSSQLQAITAKNRSAAPDWIYHLLYGLNVLLPVIFGWYILGLSWLAIWGISSFNSGNAK